MRAARGAIGLERFAWPRPAVPHARAVSPQTLAQGAIGEGKARANGYELPRYEMPPLSLLVFCSADRKNRRSKLNTVRKRKGVGPTINYLGASRARAGVIFPL